MTARPRFLTVDEASRIHAYQVERFGGEPGMLDRKLLESAVAQPGQGFGDRLFHEDLAAMAAAYLYHIVKNHPFKDGNKRAGTHAALVFLALTGHAITLDPDEAERMVIDVIEARKSKDDLAAYFRRLIQSTE